MSTVYRFQIKNARPFKEVAEIFNDVIEEVEDLSGKSCVRLDCWVYADEGLRVCVVDKTTKIGQQIAKIFTSRLIRTFGERSFRVERLTRREVLELRQKKKQVDHETSA